ncbi:MAG: hypothetical protein WAX89_02980 [Alphaproteobacteria bacterium]
MPTPALSAVTQRMDSQFLAMLAAFCGRVPTTHGSYGFIEDDNWVLFFNSTVNMQPALSITVFRATSPGAKTANLIENQQFTELPLAFAHYICLLARYTPKTYAKMFAEMQHCGNVTAQVAHIVTGKFTDPSGNRLENEEERPARIVQQVEALAALTALRKEGSFSLGFYPEIPAPLRPRD